MQGSPDKDTIVRRLIRGNSPNPEQSLYTVGIIPTPCAQQKALGDRQTRIHVHTRHKLHPLCTSLFQMFVEVAEDGDLFAFAAVVASVEELSAERA